MACLTAPRRLASPCLPCRLSSLQLHLRGARQITSTPTKHASERRRRDQETPKPNPVLDEFRRRNPHTSSSGPASPGIPATGDLGASSIFEDDRRAQVQAERDAAAADGQGDGGDRVQTGKQARNASNMITVLDPDPHARERWERKKIIQTIRAGGRLKKAEFIRRTERAHLAKSHNLKTSVKKLGMLARQVAGKTIDDAITQMRYSKKKIATEVRKQLEAARDEAVVMRGMGLGQVQQEEGAENLNTASTAVSGTTTPDAEVKAAANEPVEIQLKSGKRHIVADRSKIYVDQAWVGRGPYGKLPDYRAKGRINIMRTPWTSISLVLKEEATRIREYQDREAKRNRRRLGRVWVPLPDRPIPTHRQWYSW